jgi:hypothetical protein
MDQHIFQIFPPSFVSFMLCLKLTVIIIIITVIIILTIIQWWRDIVREGTYQGYILLLFRLFSWIFVIISSLISFKYFYYEGGFVEVASPSFFVSYCRSNLHLLGYRIVSTMHSACIPCPTNSYHCKSAYDVFSEILWYFELSSSEMFTVHGWFRMRQ